MFRTITSRAIGICQRVGHSYVSSEAYVPLSFSHNKIRSAHPYQLPGVSACVSSFPTAATSVCHRLFPSPSRLASSTSRTRAIDDEALDEVNFDAGSYIDFDENVDFDAVPPRRAPPPLSRTSHGDDESGSRGFETSRRNQKRSPRTYDGYDDEEPLGLNRHQQIRDDVDDFPGGGRSKPGHRLPESLTTLLTSLRSQATTHNAELATSRSEHAVADVSFDDFGLEPSLVARLNELEYGTPFEIQAKTMKALMDGKNVVGQVC